MGRMPAAMYWLARSPVLKVLCVEGVGENAGACIMVAV